MLEHPVYLVAANAPDREIRRQVFSGEERDLAGLEARAWRSTNNLADKEQFVDMERMGRQVAMPVSIVDRCQFADSDFKTRLLPYFAPHAFAR